MNFVGPKCSFWKNGGYADLQLIPPEVVGRETRNQLRPALCAAGLIRLSSDRFSGKDMIVDIKNDQGHCLTRARRYDHSKWKYGKSLLNPM